MPIENQPQFQDRSTAGKQLAERLEADLGQKRIVVLALPTGGVPVAHKIAQRLEAPLSLLHVRELSLPGHLRLVFGAVTSDGVEVLNEEVVRDYRISQASVNTLSSRVTEDLEESEKAFLEDAPMPALQGTTVILVDDLLDTPDKFRAAAVRLRKEEPKEIIAAIPVGAVGACEALRRDYNNVFCLHTVEDTSPPAAYYINEDELDENQLHDTLRQWNMKWRQKYEQ